MKHSIANVVMMLIAAVSITSCKIGKKPTRRNVTIGRNIIKQRYGLNTVDTTPGFAKRTLANDDKKILIDKLQPLLQRQLSYTTFSGKAKMHYASNAQKQEFVAHIRISKDKIIWVNITALSGMVNVARVYITPDSLFMVNNLEKEAYKMPISEANKLLPAKVDFQLLQNLIIGNVLKPGGQPVDATDFGGTWMLDIADGNMLQQLSFSKADSTIRTLQVRTKNDSMQGMIRYGGYELTDGRLFSTGRVINLSNAGEPHYMDMNFNKAEFDQPVDFPFSIPKSYKLK